MATSTHNVAVLVGSLRKESINRKVARALALVAPSRLTLELIEHGNLPLYDEDLEETPPVAWKSFREQIRRHDAVLFITPEYNRSVPGGLKNAIDVGSRPPGRSVWSGKPGAIISASTGKVVGGFGANHHLRQSMVFLDMPALQQPELYLAQADKLFDDAGNLADDDVRSQLVKFASAFAAWIDRTARPM
jgi:chromate reductase, NAD(P)H dehydrogenase (quinone)